MDKDYMRLAEWAVKAVICFELNSASLVGAANGYSDLIKEKKDKGEIVSEYEYATLSTLAAVIDRRQDEARLMVEQLNLLGVPLPYIEPDKMKKAITDKVNLGSYFIRNAQPDAVKESMAKIMKDLDKINIDE